MLPNLANFHLLHNCKSLPKFSSTWIVLNAFLQIRPRMFRKSLFADLPQLVDVMSSYSFYINGFHDFFLYQFKDATTSNIKTDIRIISEFSLSEYHSGLFHL